MEILWSALIGAGIVLVMAVLVTWPDISDTIRYWWRDTVSPRLRPTRRKIKAFVDRHEDAVMWTILILLILTMWMVASLFAYSMFF